MALRRAATRALRQIAERSLAAEASSSSLRQGAASEALLSAWTQAHTTQLRVSSSAFQNTWAQRASFHCWQGAHFAAQPAVLESSDDSQEAEPQSAGSKAAKRAAETSQPSPEACDDVAGLLKLAQERVDRQKMYGRETTMQDRLNTAVSAARLLVVKIVGFVASLPQKFLGVLKMTSAERGEMYQGWWTSIKKEAYHYWMGTKLLGTDVRIAARLVSKTVRGRRLSRRERQQLTRTSADVFRLVPMLVFVLIPFMELLLPVALKLFPNMLPSTFEDKLKKEEKLKRSVTAKLEVARFLQDTVEEMAKSMASTEAGSTQASAAELYAFLKRVRAGEAVDHTELTKFAQLFNDELTLDNLERIHLVNLCRFVGIQPFGTDTFLVARLRSHLHAIKRDDKAIENEGLENLTDEELRSACRARGMRGTFGSGAAAHMQRQLHDWLDLSLHRALPSSLLLLSRAFMVSQPRQADSEAPNKDMDQLREALSSLPDKVIAEASLEKLSDAAEEDLGTEYARKLEELHLEEQLIHKEELEAEGLLDNDAPSMAADESAQKMTAHAAAAAVVREATASAAVDVFDSGESSDKASRLAAAKEEKMRKVLNALGVLASSSGVSNERQIFMELVKTEIGRLNKQLISKGSVSLVFHAGGVQSSEQPKELVQVVGQQRLATKVTSILNRIEEDLDSVDTRIGEAMHVLDVDNDGLISKEELQAAMGFLHDQLGEDDLRAMLERLNAWNEDQGEAIPVSSLMSLAQDAAGPQQMRTAVAHGSPS